MVLTDLGATLVSVLVPDKDGVLRDVVLGYDTPQGYLDHTCFFGTVIGRSGNRIDKGHFVIDGKEYQLAINDNENNLHSGPDGYEKRKWEVVSQGENTISFALESPDGDQGYPGNCQGESDLHIDRMTMTVELHYEADLRCRIPLLILTNHAYFNLGRP